MSDESTPIRTVTPEQIREAREGAAALDLAEIAAAHEAVEAAGGPDPTRGAAYGEAHEHRAALLTALREERAKVERLRAALEPFVKEKAAALALDATRTCLNAPPIPPGAPTTLFVCDINVDWAKLPDGEKP